jgi:hypothetical protein
VWHPGPGQGPLEGVCEHGVTQLTQSPELTADVEEENRVDREK